MLVPSRFSADYYREALGLDCVTFPDILDGLRCETNERIYLTFVNPSIEKGVYAFARIADELGRRRPDIPILVVESRGTEATVADCGLELRDHGTVNFMAHTADPRQFWGVTKVCLLPSVCWESQPLVAVEAMINGIPVIGSDRGGIPETLGAAGIVLPLPDRITPATRMLPTAEEVEPWVQAVIRLWDDAEFYEEHRKRALAESRRWDPEVVEPLYARFFEGLAARGRESASHQVTPPDGEAARRVEALAGAFPWPVERPRVEPSGEHPGWLGAGTDELLARELSDRTRLVVELGAWRGMSARFIADHAPNAVVVSVDHWEGSPEHRAGAEFRAILPELYESFLAETWAYRDRVIPLRMTTLDGLRAVAEHGLAPDLIFVDAEHSEAAVGSELDLASRLFPNAVLVGDDCDWDGVRRAVDGFASRHGLQANRVGWRGWKLAQPSRSGAFLATIPPGRAKAAVLVPHLNGVDWECEQSLRKLEEAGVRVVRSGGISAIDVARNRLASDALHDGAESILFIDADLGFDPLDALRLLARPEPVVSGVYAKKGRREFASVFAEGVEEVVFGANAPGLYPLKYAATGFLRIKASVLRRMIAELDLPHCNRKWGRGEWPFFQPTVVPQGDGEFHYLGEDWAFSHRLARIGVTPMADTSIRLWHYGRHPFDWEDAGAEGKRFATYSYRLGGR